MRRILKRPDIGHGSRALRSAATLDEHRPEPPPDANNLVVVVLDSLRYDSFCAAETPNIDRLGDTQRRWSYASWTAPSHHNLLMGLLPHSSPTKVYASDYYTRDLARFSERLAVEDVGFARLLPRLHLPSFLRDSLGYRTSAMVSMPVLNPSTTINVGFDHFDLMPSHNDMAAMVDRLRFDGDRPWFHLLNVGETHYPYATPEEDPGEWPRISGVHGVFKHLDDLMVGGKLQEGDEDFFESEELERLRRRQVRATAYVDGVVERLFDVSPPGTWIIVTADHGELFGEGGYFGHGPILHDKVLEVPFVEGRIH